MAANDSVAERSSDAPVDMRHVPVGEEREVGHQHLGRQVQQPMFAATRHRQHGGPRRGMDGSQHVDRRPVALRVGRTIDEHALATEILHQQQAGLAVGGDDRRHGKADRLESGIDGEHGLDSLCPEGGAAVAHGRHRRSLPVHQDGGGDTVAHALEPAGRAVALQVAAGGA